MGRAIVTEKRYWICYIEYGEFGKKMSCTFTAIVYWEEDVYVAECPEVGTASQGETILDKRTIGNGRRKNIVNYH